ncbi:uncharacterized protein [Palaemon carinicauda]|uniref:uncharacterized protein n=1 Tax=Palaemon carinicauda TaxID=392227 RepID=UPI0035B61D70
MNCATTIIWKKIQAQEYGSEIKSLSKKESKVKKSSKISKLQLFLQEGLLKVGGRLCEATISDSCKHPIILPSESPIGRKMVRWTHVTNSHCGQNHIMAELRKNYWIVHGNSVVRSVIRDCVICRRLGCRPVNQVMADLPSDRICPGDPPFTNTGADCFGPFFVKQGRSIVKRWEAIFTCLTVRAIYLEVLSSMDQEFFMNAVRRFTAR